MKFKAKDARGVTFLNAIDKVVFTERGCVEDQPQRPGTARVLRLVPLYPHAAALRARLCRWPCDLPSLNSRIDLDGIASRFGLMASLSRGGFHSLVRLFALALVNSNASVFTSDNGPWLTFGDQGGSAGLLRDGKGGSWEGGLRVPGLAWCPGRIKGGQVINR